MEKNGKVQQVEQLRITKKKCPATNTLVDCINDCVKCSYYAKWVEEFAEELENERKGHR